MPPSAIARSAFGWAPFVWALAAGGIAASADRVSAAEIAVLNEATWAEFAHGGKEVDAIYGDIVLRNDWLVPVIARPNDPAQIDIDEMVHAAEHRKLVMTNAPFLEVSLKSGGSEAATAGPGDDLALPGGKAMLHVRVQCANWYDVDRVQVSVNGRPDETLDFTRKTASESFTDRTVRFERKIESALAHDSHLVVAAIGEGSRLGAVMGPEHADELPIAVTNPIFVDVDGKGFSANKDTLGAPLPVKNADRKKK